jgi:hypothetical protein
MKISLLIATISCIISTLSEASERKIESVMEFTGLYPASNTLCIPFSGCVSLTGDAPNPEGEEWLSLDHILEDEDYDRFEILIDRNLTILGARAKFKGTLEEWKGERGYRSRSRAMDKFLGGDGPDAELSRELPLDFSGVGFGDMLYNFDIEGNISWRKAPTARIYTAAEYTERQEQHKRECEECKNMNTAPRIVLTSKQKEGEQ